MSEDRRLIEDYIPIGEISKESAREKSIRKGHISTLHLWWARRPLVATRAAIYASLIQAPETPQKRTALKKAMIDLCQWEADENTIKKARKSILEAQRDRLGLPANTPLKEVPPPKVLDMFAGGGAIPLESLRLGCETYAVDLNPVAHIIELCTLVYPQKYGKQLATEVEKWGNWVIEKVRAEIGDLYPEIKIGEEAKEDNEQIEKQIELDLSETVTTKPQPAKVNLSDRLVPVAYLWTRTVKCPNPSCGADVPLVRQTWLCKKKKKYVALKVIPNQETKKVEFKVVEATTAKDLGFDPSTGSSRGNFLCRHCGTTVNVKDVKAEGKAGRIEHQLMAIVYAHKTTAGWTTLIDSLRRAGFIIAEAFPLDTEKTGRLREQNSAALASSIFLVARKRIHANIGDYAMDVQPQLRKIVQERVKTLMNEGVSGADLVIACVGAGLRAYTQYETVELPNGEELEASTFLDEVQKEVAETILKEVLGCDQKGVSAVDKPTQYYILARYEYGEAIVEFDEANTLARGVGVELDGVGGLTDGKTALVKKDKNKIQLRNYLDRGKIEDLGIIPTEKQQTFNQKSPPYSRGARGDQKTLTQGGLGGINEPTLIDILHRLLWLAEHKPSEINNYLVQAQPDGNKLKLVAQSLAGRALTGNPHPGTNSTDDKVEDKASLETINSNVARSPEQQAIDTLLASWKRTIEDNLFTRGGG